MTENMSVAIKAIRDFVYFTRNYPCYPREMCEQIWGKGCNGDHFFNKLKGYDYDMARFFLELSTNNQTKFAEWIINNYECGYNKYEDASVDNKPNTYFLLGEEAAAWYAEEGIEAVLEHSDELSFDVTESYCRDSYEKRVFLNGVEAGHDWDGVIEITEEDYKTLIEKIGLL